MTLIEEDIIEGYPIVVGDVWSQVWHYVIDQSTVKVADQARNGIRKIVHQHAYIQFVTHVRNSINHHIPELSR
jgi:hypothetical protein